jgi:dihydrolipoamide dehydrogenase
VRRRGTVLSEKKLVVTTSEEKVEINCEKIILATGAEPLLPPIQGINLDGVMTSNEALNMETLPDSMVIKGAGDFGIEFASMLAPLGVKITIIELKDRILSGEDGEIAIELQKLMKRQGITFKLSAKVTEIEQAENGLEVHYDICDKAFSVSCNKVLVAVGRKLNPDKFSNLSLHMKNGAVVTDDRMETNIKGIYAAGDLTGNKLLAHLAFMEGRIAAENALGLESRMDYSAVPSCVYTNPEVAAVGMTEEEAKEAGIFVKVGRFQFRNNGRALTLGEREGFVKVIANGNNEIIGGQILGVNASEMISELTLAIKLKAKAGDLADMIHPHPTLSEAIWEACGDIMGKAIHKMN